MEIELGKIYKHYKGIKYIVTDIGYLESDGEEMICYQQFPNNPISTTWIRPTEEFKEKFKIDTDANP